MVKLALETGATSPEAVAAELMVEALAKAAHRRDPSRSLEQHYAAALADESNRDLVALLG